MASDFIPVVMNFKDYTLGILPRILNSILIIFLGIIIGKLVGRLIYVTLKKIKIDEYLSTESFTINFSRITSTFIRWWIYLAFLSAALSDDVLGIQILSDWIMQINSFIPKVVGASLVFLVGLFIGEFIRDQIEYTKTSYSNYISKVTFFFIMYVAFAIALDIVGIPTELINSVLLVVLASFGLGFAIAFGLGFKDVFSDMAKKYKSSRPKRRKKRQ